MEDAIALSFGALTKQAVADFTGKPVGQCMPVCESNMRDQPDGRLVCSSRVRAPCRAQTSLETSPAPSPVESSVSSRPPCAPPPLLPLLLTADCGGVASRGLFSPLTPDKMHAAPPPPTGSSRILPPSRGPSGGANDEAAAVAAAASASAASSWQLVLRLRGAARRWRRTRRARAAASLLTMARQDWCATPRGLPAHLDLRDLLTDLPHPPPSGGFSPPRAAPKAPSRGFPF